MMVNIAYDRKNKVQSRYINNALTFQGFFSPKFFLVVLKRRTPPTLHLVRVDSSQFQLPSEVMGGPKLREGIVSIFDECK